MKRTGFLGLIAGALAAAHLPLPIPPPSFRCTFGTNWVKYGEAFPIALSLDALENAFELSQMLRDEKGMPVLALPRAKRFV